MRPGDMTSTERIRAALTGRMPDYVSLENYLAMLDEARRFC